MFKYPSRPLERVNNSNNKKQRNLLNPACWCNAKNEIVSMLRVCTACTCICYDEQMSSMFIIVFIFKCMFYIQVH